MLQQQKERQQKRGGPSRRRCPQKEVASCSNAVFLGADLPERVAQWKESKGEKRKRERHTSGSPQRERHVVIFINTSGPPLVTWRCRSRS